VLSRDFEQLIHGGDPRWATPDKARLLAGNPGDLSALLRPILAGGALDITIVGDITVDQAIAATAATFGALPPRPARERPPAGGLAVHFPAPSPTPLAMTDTGRADQAIAVVAWPLTDFFADMQRSRAAMLAGEVLENRVVDQMRIAQGATYSPETRASLSEVFPGYGFAFSEVEMPPDKIPGFYADVAKISADMRSNLVSADELERARNPRVEGIRKAQLTNEYWLSRLAGSMADPRQLDLIRTTLPDYAKVTVEDVRSAARQWLVDDKAWKLVISAAKPTAP